MEIRKCKFCGLQLLQREDETLSSFLHRIYCDRKCSMDGARKDRHWRNGVWPVPYRRDM